MAKDLVTVACPNCGSTVAMRIDDDVGESATYKLEDVEFHRLDVIDPTDCGVCGTRCGVKVRAFTLLEVVNKGSFSEKRVTLSAAKRKMIAIVAPAIIMLAILLTSSVAIAKEITYGPHVHNYYLETPNSVIEVAIFDDRTYYAIECKDGHNKCKEVRSADIKQKTGFVVRDHYWSFQ